MYKYFFKRLFDFLLSLIAIILLSPILIVLAILVRVKLGGPVLFKQKRPGKNGKIFMMYKFRTMTNKKDANGELLPDSQRLTKFGKLLRATSLDELPELFNILNGDMSIVGPRPLLVQYLPLYNEFQSQRHKVRPGLTGWAQVNGRNAISWESKFEFDVEYVNKISFLFDLKILFKTVFKVFKREGVNQQGEATMEYFTGNKKKINILILSVGRRVELVKLFKQASLNLDIDSKIIAVDISNTAPALFFADKHYIIPRIVDKNYLDTLISICNNENISLIVPTIDTELTILSQNKNLIESKTSAKVLISSEECVEICQDKIKTVEFFNKHGFGFPKTYDKNSLLDKDYNFPLFIKPKNGSSSINAFKVNNEKELVFFNEYINEPIIQEFIAGTEFTIDVMTDFDSNIISIVPRERLSVRSGEVLKGKIRKNKMLIDNIKELVKCLKPIGPITVQCIVTGEVIKYIEINPRFGGGAPMSMKSGANSCEALYKLLQGQNVEYSEDYLDEAVFSRFDDCIMIEKTND